MFANFAEFEQKTREEAPEIADQAVAAVRSVLAERGESESSPLSDRDILDYSALFLVRSPGFQ